MNGNGFNIKGIIESLFVAGIVGLIAGYMMIGGMRTEIRLITNELKTINEQNEEAHIELRKMIFEHLENNGERYGKDEAANNYFSNSNFN